jgi:molybdopterin converting factor small subunit
MTTLQQEIAESFLKELEESKHLDARKVEELRALISDGKKLKADDIIKILAPPAGGDLN